MSFLSWPNMHLVVVIGFAFSAAQSMRAGVLGANSALGFISSRTQAFRQFQVESVLHFAQEIGSVFSVSAWSISATVVAVLVAVTVPLAIQLVQSKIVAMRGVARGQRYLPLSRSPCVAILQMDDHIAVAVGKYGIAR